MRTLTAHRFVLRARDGRDLVARALVCPEIQYACVRWESTERLERVNCKPNLWHSLSQELAEGIAPGPLPQISAPAIMLAGAVLGAVMLEYLGAEEVEATQMNPAPLLDRRLDRRHDTSFGAAAE